MEAVGNFLGAKGYEVTSSFNSEEGMGQIKASKPDLILLDIMMRTFTEGLLFANKLGRDESYKDIPIIIVTGVKKDAGLSYGFGSSKEWPVVREVLEKPINPEELLAAVEKYI